MMPGIGCYRRVHHLVAEYAATQGGQTAVSGGGESLTWSQLERASNRLARHLQSLGAGPEVPVALYFERTPAFVVAALATWKAGGGYLPLDPAYPPERIRAAIEDAQAPILLSHKRMAAALRPGPWVTVDLDVNAGQIACLPPDPVDVPVSGGNLAYLIYTSGSTGKPKGIEVTHANLSHLIGWHRNAFGVTPADRASQIAGLGFDAAVWEIWCHLAAGASVFMIDPASRLSPEALFDWLVEQRITIAFVPTVMAEVLITLDWKSSAALRTMLTGADTLHRYPRSGLPFRLVNNYGPTECTVLVTSGTVQPQALPGQLPAIGRPIDGAEIHILDENLRPVPDGRPGELCVAGPCVTRGYRNLPELTAQRFIVNPFGAANSRMYRTGDRARVLPSGEIAFLGRLDSQIKIRGFRVEPDEITALMDEVPEIRASAVAVREDERGERTLLAYVVPVPGCPVARSAIREHLASRLPYFMIPSAFVRLESLPLTPNGKCDLAALPAPSPANLLGDVAGAEDSPATDTEKRVAQLVTSLMPSAAVGREDNIFLAGGHSMLAAQLLVRIRESLGASLTLRQLFEAPTIASLSAEVERSLAGAK